MKRDHITSHIRVHVPLKPHKCDFCGKAFKRPQDLKKHVKTHADDSVLAGSPGQNVNRNHMSGMGGHDSKREYDSQNVFQRLADGALTASSYYPSGHDNQMGNPYGSYQPSMPAGSNGASYPQHHAGQYAGYGSVSYPNSNVGEIHSLDTRKRAIEALNDFLGDIKRRALNPGNYYDVGQRLGGNALPLPVSSGYNTGYNNTGSGSFNNMNAASLLEAFNSGHDMTGGGGGGMHGPVAQSGYSLPLPNARTKNDLQDIDRFLEQLQATVYETSNSAAAAGVQQPGMHAQYGGDYGFGGHQSGYRSSNSPPSFQQQSAGGASTFGNMSTSISNLSGASGAPSALDTPALTPASVSSYSSSGQSPMSSHSRSSIGAISSGAMYPSLPSVTGMSDIGSGYPITTSAPASGLASAFDGLDGRRYSGGRLQRQAPSQDTEMVDVTDESGARTPKASDGTRPNSKGNSTIDPALRGEELSDRSSTPAARSEGEEKRQEDWVENIRTIEALRKYISERLTKGEFEDDSPSSDAKEGANDTTSKMAEIAQLVEEKTSHAEVRKEDSEVAYPALPSA